VNYLQTENININGVIYKSAIVDLYNIQKLRFSQLVSKKQELPDVGNCVLKFNTALYDDNPEYFVATEITTKDCKRIFYHKPNPSPVKPPLNLPNWTPTCGCVDNTRQCLADLEWDNGLDLPFDIVQ